MHNRYYYHNAGLGDMIYCLPTLAEIGSGHMVYNARRDFFDAIKPLMLLQPQILSFEHKNDTDLPKKFIDLGLFRNHPYFNDRHLINIHREWFKLPVWKHHQPFLVLPYKPRSNEVYAVVNVTPRYRDAFFRWGKEMEWLNKQVDKIYFLGFVGDYYRFMRTQHIREKIEFLHTENLLEAAYIIRDAKYFSGNESSLLAIRQALHLPYRVQRHPFVDHVITHTNNETILNKSTYKLHRNISLIKKYTIGWNEKNDINGVDHA